MSSRCRSIELAAALLLACAPVANAAPSELRICADPNDLPFSDAKGGGFENRIAELLARDLGVPVTYAWTHPRRGLVRNTLGSGACDVLMGVPAGLNRVATTAPLQAGNGSLTLQAAFRVTGSQASISPR